MARGITNPMLDDIYEAAMKNGASGGKVSGAGGGGFMFFYCPGNTRSVVIEALKKFGGQTKRYDFYDKRFEELDDMNNFFELAKSRYSVRNYLARPVEEEKLNYILECGRIAPSAANYQPWVINVVRDPDLKTKTARYIQPRMVKTVSAYPGFYRRSQAGMETQ